MLECALIYAQSTSEDPSVSLARAVDAITAPPEPAEQPLALELASRPGITALRPRNPADNEVVFGEFMHLNDTDEDGNPFDVPRKVRPSIRFLTRLIDWLMRMHRFCAARVPRVL